MTITNAPSCWIITEGLAGTENQCLGVAQALGITPVVKRTLLNEPWKTLSPYLGLECAGSFTPRLEPPWPDLVLSSGRKSIAAARYIKRQSKGKSVIVQIQDPRISARHFDLVCVPAHDPLRGDNVFVTTAAPNRVTREGLDAAKESFSSLAALPAPRVAVLIGGTSKAYTMTRAVTEKLAHDLSRIQGSLMITCSRRTGEDNREILEKSLNGPNHFFWSGAGENPYMGMLAYADCILVTADSTSMLSEAATTGKPVYMIPLEGGSKRITSMHNTLIKHGALKIFNGALEPFTYPPLTDAQNIAQEIKKRFGLFTHSP